MFVGWVGVQLTLLVGVLLLGGWEVIENLGLMEWIGCYGESSTNYLFDLLIGTLAMGIGIAVAKWRNR